MPGKECHRRNQPTGTARWCAAPAGGLTKRCSTCGADVRITEVVHSAIGLNSRYHVPLPLTEANDDQHLHELKDRLFRATYTGLRPLAVRRRAAVKTLARFSWALSTKSTKEWRGGRALAPTA